MSFEYNSKFYVTTPIYYANGEPHLGHLYTTVIADVIAKYNRLQKRDVCFATGMDEHGQKVELTARKLKVHPQSRVDEIADKFSALYKAADITYDAFIRTTEMRHKDFVVSVWNILYERGWIYKGEYSGWYAERDEAFYSEEEIVNGKAPTGADVVFCSEECYFFKLSALQEELLKIYRDERIVIQPKLKLNEVVSFIERGLKDLCISRNNTKWGIPVPNATEQTIYVWIDALMNYASTLSQNFESKYWPCDVQVIGKDILIFHTVYWPALLIALNIQDLPLKILVHGWWLNDGQKMSKSLNNVIAPQNLIDKYTSDYVRYFLIRETRIGHDASYSDANLQKLVNAELVNNIGNLAQRSVMFVQKYMDNTCQRPSDYDDNMLQQTYGLVSSYVKYMEALKFHEAIDIIMKISEIANKYFNEKQPWHKKDKQAELHFILFHTLELVRVIGILLQPFIPHGAARLLSIFYLQKISNITFDMASAAFMFDQLRIDKQFYQVFPRIVNE
ncbi:Methionine--tRNA ligase [Candidatus Fokinia solitaria]|uniref:Methionine--tRNA ligase n=1 Tax=Candidatus Fokinia solitaria TaxID=1802984 RepID=A0A2U8BST4_9RICK|nr:methionine--tRNA ligase [Candidatus Fokinia solitaria]AWD33383.1 Methionine--tRNA ligase [Candidatus Fokinia solitaria]